MPLACSTGLGIDVGLTAFGIDVNMVTAFGIDVNLVTAYSPLLGFQYHDVNCCPVFITGVHPRYQMKNSHTGCRHSTQGHSCNLL